jgi:hypothetical protein
MSQVAKAVSRAVRKIQPTQIELPSATGINYNDEWSIKLQAGMTYHSIELETNLKEVPTIKRVTLDIGGTPVAYATNVMMNMLDVAYKKFQQEGIFTFDFSKFEFRSVAGIFQTQLVTEINDDVTLLIEFGAKGATDPATPTLKGRAWVTDNDRAGRMYIPSRYELTQYSAAAGEHVWDLPNGSVNRHVQRIVFKEDVVAITKIKVKRGRKTIHTLSRAALNYALQRHAGVALQAGYCILDFTIFGFGNHGAMQTAGLSFEFTVDGAGAIKTYVEGYEQVKFPKTQA